MPRYAPEHKQQTRRRVLEETGRALRTDGPSDVTIPEIMGRAGLTQGAFYAHFASKDALLAEASAESLAESRERLLSRGRAAPRGLEMATIVAHYLSQKHRDNVTDGCPLPAFSTDAVRGSESVRRAYTEAVAELLEGFADLMPESVDGAVPDPELAVASTMVGGLLLSRAVDDLELSDRILASAHALCMRTLGGSAE